MPEKKGVGTTIWLGEVEVGDRGASPWPEGPPPLFFPGPWELTHCGLGWCGPSQTPSTVIPLENLASRLAGTQHPRCLWRSRWSWVPLGLSFLSPPPHPQAGGRTRAGRSSQSLSNSPGSPPPPASSPVRLCRSCTAPYWHRGHH